MTTNTTTPQAIPSHVPEHLVFDGDPWEVLAQTGKRAHERVAAFHREFPRVFWAARLSYLGGCWVPQSAEDLRRILQDPETFSNEGLTGFSALLGETWPLLPLEVDPPRHMQYRALLNPLFTPKKVNALEADIRAMAQSLVDDVAPQGHCDFNAAFAEQFPILIFLKLMGWPLDEAPRFVSWTQTLVKGDDIAKTAGAAMEIATYLRARLAGARENPGDDFCSYVVNAKVEGRSLTEEEALGMCFLVFIAGLDTVTSALGFQLMHLAQHPEQQEFLRANPDRIPDAVEELLRAYSIVTMRRQVTRDVQIGDVLMKKGDFVMMATPSANLDSEAFSNPETIDFDREDKRHMAFSLGPHRCAGSHLARRELAIAIETWLARVPPFSLKDEDKIIMRAAGVFGLDGLHLRWK
ncbi:cytochrome P450 [Spongiibacter sp. KMU-166]|uniref:Cytochrome P450 n=1 Tax=Spongiibacter thalassae TaxID=2721624 RepID=A0ABX1GCV1_9GAMM|nr:cytochrome P450 [Spongiibacter thalassae]NKI16418.1 cytochrome P450 [Spongiibacter thalassae]